MERRNVLTHSSILSLILLSLCTSFLFQDPNLEFYDIYTTPVPTLPTIFCDDLLSFLYTFCQILKSTVHTYESRSVLCRQCDFMTNIVDRYNYPFGSISSTSGRHGRSTLVLWLWVTSQCPISILPVFWLVLDNKDLAKDVSLCPLATISRLYYLLIHSGS